ncbi:DHH family phosphoesterase [Elizabethkingia meningoseptica]
MFSNQELSDIKNLLQPDKEIVIVTHYNPDGDAIGSSLGLKHALKSAGIEATIVVPNDFPRFLKWMPDSKQIMISEFKRKKVAEILHNADVIFCLDFNTLSRIGFIGEWIARSSAAKILIDHHQMPDEFDYVYSDTTIPATCQMVYHFLEAMGWESNISEDSAICLYTGIMTDTGGFRFRSTSATTHRIIANLIERGADPAQITSDTWDTNTISRLHLLSLVLSRIELIKEGTVAVLWLKREEMEQFGFEKGATEGFVNYGLSVLGVKMSAFFMEDIQEDFIKISFRSKDELDVNQFSRSYFSGGGHINAAGGRSELSMEDTIQRFKEIIEKEGF